MDSNDSAVYNFGTEPVVTYCNVSGGFTGDGNIDADPLFTNPTKAPASTTPTTPPLDIAERLAVCGRCKPGSHVLRRGRPE
jgi:hypothetical protein